MKYVKNTQYKFYIDATNDIIKLPPEDDNPFKRCKRTSYLSNTVQCGKSAHGKK